VYHVRFGAAIPRKEKNSLEVWHNAFNGVVNKAHASIRTLVTKLRLEESSSVAKKIERVNAGHPTQKKRKKYLVDPGSGGPWEWRPLGMAARHLISSLEPLHLSIIYVHGVHTVTPRYAIYPM